MARSKSKPRKGISVPKKTTPAHSASALYKSNSASSSKPKPSSAKLDASCSKKKTLSDSSIHRSKENITSKRSSDTQKKSKRKSFLPSRRLTFTEEFRSSSKHVNINRFGKTEICGRKTWNELKYYQKTTFLLIPKLPFSRLVREIMDHFGTFRITPTALEALQEASEIYLTTVFTAANLSAAHARRKTVRTNDMALSLFISRLNL